MKSEILALLQQMPKLTSGWRGFYLESLVYVLKREYIEFPFLKNNHLQHVSYVTHNTPSTVTFLWFLPPVNIFETKAKVENKPLFVMTATRTGINRIQQIQGREMLEENQANIQVLDCPDTVHATETCLVFLLN